ncbi:hypothetical protein ACFQ3N_09040 [Virgibacillus byunsanensis]|uniref:DUF3679 domain-containing protein n=1 Tax=Virgibacillus byunsanensis TaxID=570945 RepID=A0ABW3LJJ0_9BACI
MVRSIIVLLLVAVFFLTGMVLGIDKGQNSASTVVEDEVKTTIQDQDLESVEKVTNKDVLEPEVNNNIMNIQEPVHFTQKMANFLETLVKGFYDIVVEIVYQIAQLFF